eukprot:548914-Alexandrium_andersonii.AAC.1
MKSCAGRSVSARRRDASLARERDLGLGLLPPRPEAMAPLRGGATGRLFLGGVGLRERWVGGGVGERSSLRLPAGLGGSPSGGPPSPPLRLP